MKETDKQKRVIVTKAFVGICHMQVCAINDATDEEILEVCNRENFSGTSLGWCEVVRRQSERRRALAELKALIGETCNFCLAGLPYVLDVNGKGYGGHPNESGGGHFICTDYRVRNRIAEIEAEEA